MSNENRDAATSAFVAGVVAGAASMYFLDPDRGRRRRALVRDKVTSTADRMAAFAGAAVHDASGRVRGVAAGTRRALAAHEIPDDLQLIERVRSKIGRVVGNPHGIHVGARDGRVVLSGDVLAREASQLRDTVRSVPGVRDLEDHLVLHESSTSVPSLQGAEQRSRIRSARGDRWSPATRGAALAAGALLLLRRFGRGGIAGLAAAGIGLALGLSVAARSASHGGPTDLPAGDQPPQGNEVEAPVESGTGTVD